MRHRYATLAVLAALAGSCPASFAHHPGHDEGKDKAAAADKVAGKGWTLAAADSRLSFVSIKNDQIAEVHHFPTLSGTVDAGGKLALEIPLDAVETGIPIRNERLRTLLFDTAAQPVATVTAQVDVAAVQGLRVGKSIVVSTPATLALHGVTGEVPGEFRISRISAKQWLVTTEMPLIVNASAFGLVDGVEALRSIAKLQTIAAAVPVTAALVFDLAAR